MLTFQRIKWEDIPEVLRKRILSWSDKEMIIDDVGLTVQQIQKIIDFMQQEGYKQV